MWSCRRTGKAVWETRRPFSFFLEWILATLRQPRGGALDRLTAAQLGRRDLLFHEGENFRRGGIGRAGIERWCRIIFEPELDHLRGLPVDHDRHERQREIDPRGDTAAGDTVAVDTDAGFCRLR